MSQPNRILFLYTEMAGYFLACIDALAQRNVEVHVIHWPVNKEASFDFGAHDTVQFYDRSTLADEALESLVGKIKPTVIICSGWLDKTYVRICRKHYGNIPTVLTSDNHWTGSPKQQIARVISRFTIRRMFSHAWVPGAPQQQYVHKLGFPIKNTATGFYCADYELFHEQGQARLQRTEPVPKRFVFVGRYLDFKGIFELWKAFIRLRNEGCEWELWCFGTGALWEQRIEHEGIVHHGFAQPAELTAKLAETGVFVLPSHKEPWGVVVHEMAAAGFPMLCSKAVGAASKFLEEGKNGYTFTPGSEDAIYSAMKQLVAKSDAELKAMGQHSAALATAITPETWANTVESFIPA